MNTTRKNFLKLLNIALQKDIPISPSMFSSIELNRLYQTACNHKLQALIFTAFSSEYKLSTATEQLFNKWKNNTIFSSISQHANITQIQKVLESFNIHNVQVIPLKGLLLRELYPLPDLRTMGDADLLIHKEDLDSVKALLSSLGYEEFPDSHAYHVTFKHPCYNEIEIHWALTNYQSFNVQAIKHFEEEIWHHTAPTNIVKVPTLSMSLEDHFIYLILHMANHMKYAGFGIRQVTDSYLYLIHYADKLNWHAIQLNLSLMGLYPFFTILMATMNIFFQDTPSLPTKGFQTFNSSILHSFVDEIFESGATGGANFYHGLASTFIHSESTPSTRYATSIRTLLFPPIIRLKMLYPYLNKCFLLTPIAYIHHLLSLLFRKDQSLLTKLKALLLVNQNKNRRKKLFSVLKID